MSQRVLGPRQRVRTGAAFAIAAAAIGERLEAGEQPRVDGFFEATGDDHRPAAEELLEGVLQTAGDAYEERKVEFLGKLYAGLVFDPSVSRRYAHLLLRLARELTFRQMAVMAVIWEGSATPREAEAAQNDPPEGPYFNDDLGLEVDSLERMGLVGRGEPGGTPKRGGATFVDAGSLRASSLTLTSVGRSVYVLMGLQTIPEDARDEILLDFEQRPHPT